MYACCTCVCTHVWMHLEARDWHWVPHSAVFHLSFLSFCWLCSSLIWPEWLASESWRPSYSCCPAVLGLEACPLCLVFYMGTMDLNSDPHLLTLKVFTGQSLSSCHVCVKPVLKHCFCMSLPLLDFLQPDVLMLGSVSSCPVRERSWETLPLCSGPQMSLLMAFSGPICPKVYSQTLTTPWSLVSQLRAPTHSITPFPTWKQSFLLTLLDVPGHWSVASEPQSIGGVPLMCISLILFVCLQLIS